jgi:putative ABC transport system permease protein
MSLFESQSRSIAYRNVGRQKKRSFLLGGAIAFGFFVITTVGALTGGLLDIVKENFTHTFGGHIYISGSEVNERGREISYIPDRRELDQALVPFADEMTAVNLRSRARGELVFGSKVFTTGVIGVNYANEENFVDNLILYAGSLDDLYKPDTIILPREAADKLNIEAGENILFKLDTITGQRNVADLTVIAIVQNQEGLGTSSGYMNLESLNVYMGMESQSFQTMNIFLRDIDDLDALGDRIYTAIDQSSVTDLDFAQEDLDEGEASLEDQRNSMMRMMGMGSPRSVDEDQSWVGTRYGLTTLNDVTSQLVEILNIIQWLGLIVFIVIMLITMVGVMNSYRMVMIERTQEIGTMRAIGLQKESIRGIFLWESFFIAVGGAIAGFVLSLITMGVLGLVNFGTEGAFALFLNKGSLNFVLDPLLFSRDLIMVVALTLLAVLLPANAAAKLEPAQALRTSY